MARESHCSKCDIRKLTRRATGDKSVHKKGILVTEYLGYICHCGRKWRQKIDYTGAKQKVKWEKVS